MKTINIYDIRKQDNTAAEFFTRLNERRETGMAGINEKVSEIIANIRERGDEAILEYTAAFDKISLSSIKDLIIPLAKGKEALDRINPKLRSAMEAAAENIRKFHSCQKENSWIMENPGVLLGQLVRPLESAGIYVPAGRAPLPSTVLMCAIPAKIAGVRRVVLTTPPGKDGKISDAILAAAAIAEVNEIYMMGGAQAVAALAFGTESIKPVDKIAGPGSIWVNAAKRQVFGYCGIDMFAGPSEICILADCTANPDYIAADMLSQAEHDPLASSVLVTDSEEIAEKTVWALKRRLADAELSATAAQSIKEYGAVFITESISRAFDIVNTIAPEHLELCIKEPMAGLSRISNAGSIFMGNYTPEPLGDYFAGPNHTLPTSGTARFFSPLGVYDFVKRTNIIQYDNAALLAQAEMVEIFAEAEGLTAHRNAVRVRKEGNVID